MENKLLENVPLVPKYIMLNPDDLRKFDRQVGVGNRSRKIRELIRDYNKKNEVVQASE